MNYITAEQFLSLPEDMQKIFIDWWKIKVGDWVHLVDEKEDVSIVREETDMLGLIHHWYYDYDLDKLMMTGKGYDDGYPVIPLLRLDQLWEFIESNSYQIGINNFIEKDLWNLKVFKNMMQFEPDIEVQDKDKLQAFWEVAVIIASGD